MSISQQTETTETRTAQPAPKGAVRSLVLVVGSGRSGTSLFTGILQRLGFHVPQPEVPADSTNPRGFAESQWVVDFHTRLLRQAGVQVSDARPSAWSHVADLSLDDRVADELRKWLGGQFKQSDHLIIKDPRLSWFLPLWRRCAEDLKVSPGFATVLRHPAAVVDSKQRSYGGWQGDVSRTAGWLNQTLFTERATREGPRVLVRYEDLLEDWTSSVARVGDLLDLQVIRDAPAASIVRVHDFVDRGLSRSRATWDDFDIPVALREQVDQTWEMVSRIAEGKDDERAFDEQLDAIRAAYIRLYEDAEAIAQSSLGAAPRGKTGRNAGIAIRLARKVPRRFVDRMPLRWRKAAYRSAHGGNNKRR
jgi:hypothetical protein